MGASDGRHRAGQPKPAAASVDQLASRALQYCLGANLKIAAAESLTGGLVADAFVRIPGASRVFLGSAVTYDIRAKASILHVDRALLERSGAVHPDVARQMAVGAAALYAQPEYDAGIFGLATTCLAGPGPDGGKPAGLVYVAMAVPPALGVHGLQTAGFEAIEHDDDEDGADSAHGSADDVASVHGAFGKTSVVVRRLMLHGTREEIRRATVHHAVRLITEFIADSQE